MAVTSTAPREPAPAPARATHSTTRPAPARPTRPAPAATDDEILGLESDATSHASAVGAGPGELGTRTSRLKPAPTDDNSAPNAADNAAPTAEPAELRAALDANPELRQAWDDAQSFRESFATPDEARTATALLADLDRLDALFFSRRPEDHAELARSVANLDPAAFASLAQAMQNLNSVGARYIVPGPNSWRDAAHPANSPANASSVGAGFKPAPTADQHATPSTAPTPAAPTQAQTEFFHATNAAAVESVLEAIESQVERLLPDGVSKSARNRVVGEIYRELDTTLRSNRQLSQQMRDAFRSGALDADHQRALVSLVTGRARQALPGVAKRVLNEWTSTVVAANRDRRTRQQAAERRVDIAGSGSTGSDGSRSMTPRDIDYRRMSDADILNL
jgi:hypothetical protein